MMWLCSLLIISPVVSDAKTIIQIILDRNCLIFLIFIDKNSPKFILQPARAHPGRGKGRGERILCSFRIKKLNTWHFLINVLTVLLSGEAIFGENPASIFLWHSPWTKFIYVIIIWIITRFILCDDSRKICSKIMVSEENWLHKIYKLFKVWQLIFHNQYCFIKSLHPCKQSKLLVLAFVL